jgi:L-ascorbate metabolism protein UlaG (beta-lactamase superfamily)
VNLSQADLGRVKTLIEQTRRVYAPLMQLAKDLKDLDRLLQDSASGFSLNEFYARMPASLRGTVELAYDLNNHPMIRVVEELIYADAHVPEAQQIHLSVTPEQARSFFMYTPRLPSTDSVIFPMTFDDTRLDELFSMRARPASYARIAQTLGIGTEELPRFRRYFTTTREEPKGRTYDRSGVRIRYLGHACVLVQTMQTSILIDPMLAFEKHPTDGRFTFDDLPDVIDYVVITHNHQDHCSAEMLLQIRHRVRRFIVPRSDPGNIADPSIKLFLKALGIRSIDVVEPFDTIDVPGGRITSLPFCGEHAELNISSKQSLLVQLHERNFLWMVDSDGRDTALWEKIMRRLDCRIDALFLGMECSGAPLTWLYGPLLTRTLSRRDDESRRLSAADCERAWSIFRCIRPAQVYVYAMGQEPWLRYIMGLEYEPESLQLQESARFVERCRESGVVAESLRISRDLRFD